ncbi:hypothetical protein BH23BAC3_BH23BAC3_16030 [soil metagenome]
MKVKNSARYLLLYMQLFRVITLITIYRIDISYFYMAIKMLLLFLISFFIYPNSSADQIPELLEDDPVSALLEKAEKSFESGEEEKALEIYLSILTQDPENYDALWNTSFIYTRKGRRQTAYTSEEAYYRKAREFAQKTLDAHPDKPRSHYVFALASAGLADEMPNSSERIQLIWDLKEFSERALQMDPDFAPAWHLKGVWHSKIANISRTERMAAKILYGRLPDGASNKKAEEHLQRAINMEQDVILFKLDLAQHYQETGQQKKAISLLESVLDMTPTSQNDHIDLKEARERYEELR